MNGFTKENTAEATHIYTGTYAQFEKTEGKIRFVLNKQTKFEWLDSGSADEIGYGCLELSRPIGERREDHTVGGVTNYAQPQEAEMSTDNGLPALYAKVITPLIKGDIISFEIHGETRTETVQKESNVYIGELKLETVIFSDKQLTEHNATIMLFADRPNTGKQQVGDDVVVDITMRNSGKSTGTTTSSNWGDLPAGMSIETWKPNHAAMLKQYQAEQLEVVASDRLASIDKASLVSHEDMVAKFGPPIVSEKHHIELQTKATGAPDNLDFVINEDKAANDDDVTEKPVYTQAMKDAGELPPVGAKALYATLAYQVGKPCIEVGKWYSGTIIAYHEGFVWTSDNGLRELDMTEFKPIDNRTDEEKLTDEINELWNTSCDKWTTINNLVHLIKTNNLTGVTWVGE